MKLSDSFVLLFFLLFFSPSLVTYARDLHGRIGLGYNAEFANLQKQNGAPGLSIKYGMTRDIAVEGVLSLATTNPANSATAIKFFKNIFFETNLNFYFMIGGGILNAEKKSGAEILGGFGAEYFIPGVDSLGMSMETGVSFNNISGTYALRTLGFSFLNAGMHFYF